MAPDEGSDKDLVFARESRQGRQLERAFEVPRVEPVIESTPVRVATESQRPPAEPERAVLNERSKPPAKHISASELSPQWMVWLVGFW